MLCESWIVTSQPVNMRHKTVKNTIALAIDHWWLFCHSLWICMKKWRHESQSQSPLQSPILKIGVTKLMTTTTLFSQSSVSSMVLCLLSSNTFRFRHKWGGGPHGDKKGNKIPSAMQILTFMTRSSLFCEIVFSLMLCVVTITLPYFLQAFFGGGLKLLTLIPNSVCRWCEKMARIFGGMTIS